MFPKVYIHTPLSSGQAFGTTLHPHPNLLSTKLPTNTGSATLTKALSTPYIKIVSIPLDFISSIFFEFNNAAYTPPFPSGA